MGEHGFVTGRWLRPSAGSGGEPVVKPIRGSLDLVPSQRRVLDGVEGAPAGVPIKPESFELDAQGYQGRTRDGVFTRGAWLPVGRYRVVTKFWDGAQPWSYLVDVSAEHTPDAPLWLPGEAPVDLPPEAIEIVRVSDRIRAEAAAERAEAAAAGVEDVAAQVAEVQQSVQAAEEARDTAQGHAENALGSASAAFNHFNNAGNIYQATAGVRDQVTGLAQDAESSAQEAQQWALQAQVEFSIDPTNEDLGVVSFPAFMLSEDQRAVVVPLVGSNQ